MHISVNNPLVCVPVNTAVFFWRIPATPTDDIDHILSVEKFKFRAKLWLKVRISRKVLGEG